VSGLNRFGGCGQPTARSTDTSQRSCVSFNLTVPTGCSMLSAEYRAAAFNEYPNSTTTLGSNRAYNALVDSKDRQT
jgi:hypothetical protein